GKQLRTLEGGPDFHGPLSFTPDGKRVAADCSYPLAPGVTRSTVRIWDVATGKKVRDLDCGSTACLAFSPDGKALVTGDFDSRVRVWEAATGKERRSWVAHADRTCSLAFSPDGKTLATGGADGRLWDFATAREKLLPSGHSGPVRAFFTPDGRAVSGGHD